MEVRTNTCQYCDQPTPHDKNICLWCGQEYNENDTIDTEDTTQEDLNAFIRE